MTSGTIAAPAQLDIAAAMGGLYGDGIIGSKGAFDRDWVRDLGEDIEVLFQDALKRPGGAVGADPSGTMSRSIRKESAASSIWSHTHGSRAFARRCSDPSTRSWRSASTYRSPARCTSRGTATSHHRKRR